MSFPPDPQRGCPHSPEKLRSQRKLPTVGEFTSHPASSLPVTPQAKVCCLQSPGVVPGAPDLLWEQDIVGVWAIVGGQRYSPVLTHPLRVSDRRVCPRHRVLTALPSPPGRSGDALAHAGQRTQNREAGPGRSATAGVEAMTVHGIAERPPPRPLTHRSPWLPSPAVNLPKLISSVWRNLPQRGDRIVTWAPPVYPTELQKCCPPHISQHAHGFALLGNLVF